MKKLTQQEASDLIQKAALLQVKHPALRFGQALWNLLPESLEDQTGTEYDFFYWDNAGVVISTFYEHFVEAA